jgi:transposase
MVVLGVDPHKQSHTVVAVDETGRQLGQLTVKARPSGHLRLLEWAEQFECPRRWAVEDCRHVAGGLLRDLLAAGAQVVMVPPKLMAACRSSARTRGKSDPIDALAVARGALREPDLPAAHLDEESLQVRLLLDFREDMVAERTRMINRLRWHLHDLDPDLAPPVRTLTRLKVLRQLAERLAALAPSVRANLAVEIVERILADTARINDLERQITARVNRLVPVTLSIPGVAALTAAKLVGEIGGVTRLRTSAQLAMLAGAAPIPVWTGNREKHRLNRGGNRQLNAALHRIAVTQIRMHQPAQELYLRRQQHHADTKAGALRVLKRHLVDVVFKTLIQDETRRQSPEPACYPAAA